MGGCNFLLRLAEPQGMLHNDKRFGVPEPIPLNGLQQQRPFVSSVLLLQRISFGLRASASTSKANGRSYEL